MRLIQSNVQPKEKRDSWDVHKKNGNIGYGVTWKMLSLGRIGEIWGQLTERNGRKYVWQKDLKGRILKKKIINFINIYNTYK